MAGLYELTEDQEMIVASVREMARDKIAPRAVAFDRNAEYPWDIIELYRQSQILSMPIPEQYGGVGASEFTCCLVMEEIAKVCANSAHALADHWLGLEPVLLGGREEQKQKYLPQMATRIAAFSVTEPEAGSDISGVQTRAVLNGDEYVINGQKVFCTNGDVADFVTVFVRTGPDRTRGLSAFVIEQGTPGFSVGKKEDQLGMRGTHACELILDDCRVPREDIVGQEGDGFGIAMQTFNRSRPFDAALAVGIAAGALEYAIDYAKQRKQFGQSISEFQGIQFMLADMATEVEAARHLVRWAASLLDRGSPEVAKSSAMANYFATDVGVRVTNDAMQVLGGYGYIKDHPLEQKMRDARLLQIVEGTNQIQRVVVARNLLR
ncbi:acyl-CoA dehydrogenase family protein [Chloroflexota bacterium]